MTLQTEGGVEPERERVLGIQQLVAAAVTDLPARAVAVLDQRGRLLSAAPIESAAAPTQLDERSALEEYYRARARSVAEKLIPGVPFDIRVLAIPTGAEAVPEQVPAAPANGSPAPAPAPAASETAAADGRNFRLRIALRTEMELPQDDRTLLTDAIVQATGIEPGRGDMLRFETGPLEQPAPGGALPEAHPPEAPPLPPIARTSSLSSITGGPVRKRMVVGRARFGRGAGAGAVAPPQPPLARRAAKLCRPAWREPRARRTCRWTLTRARSIRCCSAGANCPRATATAY